MDYLSTTFTTTHTSTLPSHDRGAAIALLHHHPTLIELNPLANEHHVLPPQSDTPSTETENTSSTSLNPVPEGEDRSNWSLYSITDLISVFFGLYKYPVVYTAAFKDTAEGVRTFVRAPWNVEIQGDWEVSSVSTESTDGEGTGAGEWKLQLIETATVKCNVLFASFIRKSMMGSHAEIHQKLAEKLSERTGAKTVENVQ